MARELDVDPRTISSWRSGAKRPSPEMQHRIEKRLGIAASQWTQNALLGPPSAAASPLAEATPEGILGQQTAIERLRTQIARLAAARAVPNVTDRSRVELERVELAASRELARLEGRDVSLAQVVGSRHWGELQAKISKALDNSPWALAKVFAECGDDKKAYADRMRANFPELVAAVERAEAALLAACEARAAKRGAQ